jgi:hypothetical protein
LGEKYEQGETSIYYSKKYQKIALLVVTASLFAGPMARADVVTAWHVKAGEIVVEAKLGTDICTADLLVQSDGAATIAAHPAREPGTMPLAASTLSMHPERRLAFAPSDRVDHTVLGGNTETQRHRIGQHGTLINSSCHLLNP